MNIEELKDNINEIFEEESVNGLISDAIIDKIDSLIAENDLEGIFSEVLKDTDNTQLLNGYSTSDNEKYLDSISQNPNTPSFTLDELSKNDDLKENIANNPNTLNTTLDNLAESDDIDVKKAVINNDNTAHSTIVKLSEDADVSGLAMDTDKYKETIIADKYNDLLSAMKGMDSKDSIKARGHLESIQMGIIPLEMRFGSKITGFNERNPEFSINGNEIGSIRSVENHTMILSDSLAGKDFGKFLGTDIKGTDTNRAYAGIDTTHVRYLSENNTLGNEKYAVNLKEDFKVYMDDKYYENVDSVYMSFDVTDNDRGFLSYNNGEGAPTRQLKQGGNVVGEFKNFVPKMIANVEVHLKGGEVEYSSYVTNSLGDVFSKIPSSGNAELTINNGEYCPLFDKTEIVKGNEAEVKGILSNMSVNSIDKGNEILANTIKNDSEILDPEIISEIKSELKVKINELYAEKSADKNMLKDYKELDKYASEIASDREYLKSISPDNIDYTQKQEEIETKTADFKEKFNEFVTKYKDIMPFDDSRIEKAKSMYLSADNVEQVTLTRSGNTDSSAVKGLDKDGNKMNPINRLNELLNLPQIAEGILVNEQLEPSDIVSEKGADIIKDSVNEWNIDNPDHKLTYDEETGKVFDKHGIERNIQSDIGEFDKSFKEEFKEDGATSPDKDANGEVSSYEINEFKAEDEDIYKNFDNQFETSDIKIDIEPEYPEKMIEKHQPSEEDFDVISNDNDGLEKHTDDKADNIETKDKNDNNEAVKGAVATKLEGNTKNQPVRSIYNRNGKVELSDSKKAELYKAAEREVGGRVFLNKEERAEAIQKAYDKKVAVQEEKLQKVADQIVSINKGIEARSSLVGPFFSRYNTVIGIKQMSLNPLYSQFGALGGKVGADSIVTMKPNLFTNIGSVFELLTSMRGIVETPFMEFFYQVTKEPDEAENVSDKVANDKVDTPKDLETRKEPNIESNNAENITLDDAKTPNNVELSDNPDNVEIRSNNDFHNDVENDYVPYKENALETKDQSPDANAVQSENSDMEKGENPNDVDNKELDNEVGKDIDNEINEFDKADNDTKDDTDKTDTDKADTETKDDVDNKDNTDESDVSKETKENELENEDISNNDELADELGEELSDIANEGAEELSSEETTADDTVESAEKEVEAENIDNEAENNEIENEAEDTENATEDNTDGYEDEDFSSSDGIDADEEFVPENTEDDSDYVDLDAEGGEVKDKQNLIDEVKEKVNDVLEGYDNIGESLSEILEKGLSVEDLMDTVTETILDYLDGLDNLSGLLEEIEDAVASIINETAFAVPEYSDTLNAEDVRENIVSDLTNADEFSSDSMIDSLNDIVEKLYDDVESVGTDIINDTGEINGVNLSETQFDFKDNDYERLENSFENTISGNADVDSATISDIDESNIMNENIEHLESLCDGSFTMDECMDIYKNASEIDANNGIDTTLEDYRPTDESLIEATENYTAPDADNIDSDSMFDVDKGLEIGGEDEVTKKIVEDAAEEGGIEAILSLL